MTLLKRAGVHVTKSHGVREIYRVVELGISRTLCNQTLARHPESNMCTRFPFATSPDIQIERPGPASLTLLPDRLGTPLITKPQEDLAALLRLNVKEPRHPVRMTTTHRKTPES